MNILEIEEFVSKHSMKDIFIHCNTLASSPSSDNIEELIGFLSVQYYIMERYITIRYIPRLIISIGKPGIEAIEKLIRDKRGYVREAAILEVLFAASEGKEASIDYDESQPWILHPPISREISQLAHEAFVRYITDSLKDSDLFFDLSQFMYQNSLRSLFKNEIDSTIFKIISKSIINISESCLREYETLIDSQLKEQKYQDFMEANPCIIDPLANTVYNQKNLGAELITDFVVKRLDDQYILVEIEKPNTLIFTQHDDFTSKFSHAFGQIIDFQEWVESNIAYAQRILPRIYSPQGLLIIGMRRNLTDKQISKLNRFNVTTRGRVKVVTFDELLEQGRKYLENLYSE